MIERKQLTENNCQILKRAHEAPSLHTFPVLQLEGLRLSMFIANKVTSVDIFLQRLARCSEKRQEFFSQLYIWVQHRECLWGNVKVCTPVWIICALWELVCFEHTPVSTISTCYGQVWSHWLQAVTPAVCSTTGTICCSVSKKLGQKLCFALCQMRKRGQAAFQSVWLWLHIDGSKLRGRKQYVHPQARIRASVTT